MKIFIKAKLKIEKSMVKGSKKLIIIYMKDHFLMANFQVLENYLEIISNLNTLDNFAMVKRMEKELRMRKIRKFMKENLKIIATMDKADNLILKIK